MPRHGFTRTDPKTERLRALTAALGLVYKPEQGGTPAKLASALDAASADDAADGEERADPEQSPDRA